MSSDFIISLITGLICIPVSIIFTILFSDSILAFLLRFLNGFTFRQSVSIAGMWKHSWTIENYNAGKSVTGGPENITVKQLGKKISGSLYWEGEEYLFSGHIESGCFFNGEWHALVEGPTYSGVFQLKIDRTLKKLNGVWVGFSSQNSNNIRSGQWAWEKVECSPSGHSE